MSDFIHTYLPPPLLYHPPFPADSLRISRPFIPTIHLSRTMFPFEILSVIEIFSAFVFFVSLCALVVAVRKDLAAKESHRWKHRHLESVAVSSLPLHYRSNQTTNSNVSRFVEEKSSRRDSRILCELNNNTVFRRTKTSSYFQKY